VSAYQWHWHIDINMFVDDATLKKARASWPRTWPKPEFRFEWAIFRFVISRVKGHFSPYFVKNAPKNVLCKKKKGGFKPDFAIFHFFPHIP